MTRSQVMSREENQAPPRRQNAAAVSPRRRRGSRCRPSGCCRRGRCAGSGSRLWRPSWGRCRVRGCASRRRGGDGGQFLDVHVNQLTGAFAHIAQRLRGGAVAAVEAPDAFLVEDVLHRRRRQGDLRGDPGGAAAPRVSQLDDPPPGRLGCPRRRTLPAAAAIHQPVGALGEEPVTPLGAVLALTWYRCAVAATPQPSTITTSTIARRPSGVNFAFRCCLTCAMSPPCEP